MTAQYFTLRPVPNLTGLIMFSRAMSASWS